MRKFHHHPDGKIIVRTVDTSYVDTPDNFALDLTAAELPAYDGLPEGVREIVYSDEEYIWASATEAFPQTEPWDDAEAWIDAVPQLVIAQDARTAVSPPPPPPRQLAKLVIVRRMTTEELDGVIAIRAGGGTADQRRMVAEFDAATVIEPDDPPTLAGFTAMFGETRAMELLA